MELTQAEIGLPHGRRPEFCSCDVRYKSRVGGVRANEPLTLTVSCDANEVSLVLRKEGEGHVPVFYPMERVDGGFFVRLEITTAGLYFYRFVIDGAEYGSDDMCRLVAGGYEFLQLVYEGEFRPIGGVIYQIMPDRFFRKGDARKKGGLYVEDRYKTPSYLPDENGKYNNEFYGGTLAGITDKLDYIASLGVTFLYLNPIFEAASSHRYDTSDYLAIDPGLGTEDDLRRLVAEAKKRGIGVILDGVFSHTGADSVYFNKYGTYKSSGAYQSPNSPYFDWYTFLDYPDKYRSWWGFETLPEVNETSPSYLDFMLGESGVVAHWESLGISGWRLDVADELPDRFIEELRRRSRVPLIGEVWENAVRKYAYGARRKYFLGGQLDGVTAYPIRNAVLDFCMSGDNTLLRKTVRELLSDYPSEALSSSMNILGTHDTERVLTALSRDPRPSDKAAMAEYEQSDTEDAIRRLKVAALIQYVLPGTPCLYYGDEAGLTGHADPFCRKFYPWGRENRDLVAYYRRLGELRQRYASVFVGSTSEVSPSKSVFKLVRSDGKTSLTLIVNMSDEILPVRDVVVGATEIGFCQAALVLDALE